MGTVQGVKPDAMQKFYSNELKFTSGSDVQLFLCSGIEEFRLVTSLRILCPAPGVERLVIETDTSKYIFREWAGVSCKSPGQADFKLS